MENIGAIVIVKFFDKVQVDWGSFAYKGTKEQIRKLMELENVKEMK